jgi:hypothetical protein
MPHVQIDDRAPRTRYAVGGTPQTAFSVNFAFFDEDDLLVYVDDELLTRGADYTVAGTSGSEGGYPGGTVTLTDAVENVTVTIVREVPIERTSDFPNGGPLQIPTLNTDFDKIVAILQQIDQHLDRSLLLNEEDEDGDGAYNANGNRIEDLADPVDDQDAVTKAWVAAQTVSAITSTYATRAVAAATAIPLILSFLTVGGYASIGDSPVVGYKRISTPSPAKARHFQDALGNWWEITEKKVDPRSLGFATGGTAAANATALQDALDFAEEVIQPAGFYFSNPVTITRELTWRGPGKDVSGIVTGTANADLITVNTASNASVTIEGFQLQAHTTFTTGGAGIAVTSSSGGGNGRMNLEGLYIRGGFYRCIDLRNAFAWTIRGCHIHQGYNANIAIANALLPDAGDNVIEGNWFWTDNPLTFAHIAMFTSAGLRVLNNKFNDGQVGVYIAPTNLVGTGIVQIIGNSFEWMTNSVIRLAPPAGAGLMFQTLMIQDNHIGLYVNNVPGVWLAASGADAAWAQDISIKKNQFRMAAASNIAALLESGSKIDIGGNQIEVSTGGSAGVGFRTTNAVTNCSIKNDNTMFGVTTPYDIGTGTSVDEVMCSGTISITCDDGGYGDAFYGAAAANIRATIPFASVPRVITSVRMELAAGGTAAGRNGTPAVVSGRYEVTLWAQAEVSGGVVDVDWMMVGRPGSY